MANHLSSINAERVRAFEGPDRMHSSSVREPGSHAGFVTPNGRLRGLHARQQTTCMLGGGTT
jgi:hypothetical protein